MMCGHDNILSKDDSYEVRGLYFWTSSVHSFGGYDGVYQVRGNNGDEDSSPITSDAALYGVRPIITISKDLVER